MSNIPDKDLPMEQSEKALNLRIDEFLEKFNPQEMEDVAFRSADLMRAWPGFIFLKVKGEWAYDRIFKRLSSEECVKLELCLLTQRPSSCLLQARQFLLTERKNKGSVF